MKNKGISRELLYELIWSKPISEIAVEYKTDHQTIVERCKEYNIPRPDSGHWTKVRFGKKVIIPALPKSEQSEISITLSRNELASQLTKSAESIRVKQKIGTLHPLTNRTYDYLKDRRTSQHDRLRPEAPQFSIFR